MISLEQIRLLESRITRALDVIRVLKEENSTLRRGLESAQKRMRELESLVDGLKTDQREIESIIVRTLHNLDDLEETAAAGVAPGAAPSPGVTTGHGASAAPAGPGAAASAASAPAATAAAAPAPAAPAPAGAAPASRRAESRSTAPAPSAVASSAASAPAAASSPAPARPAAAPERPGDDPGGAAQKEELDIF